MPSLKDTKRRIGSVKSTQKITRAMKLVSSAKFARANRAILNARPYGEAFANMVSLMVKGEEQSSPLLEKRDEKKTLLIIVSSDRGLCGGLNSNLFKEVGRFLSERSQKGVQADLILWGKRSCMYGSKRPETSLNKEEKVLDKPDYGFVARHTTEFCRQFEEGEYDRVVVAYSHFQNAITQKPTLKQLLPVEPHEDSGETSGDENGVAKEFLFEPEKQALVDQILRQQIATDLYGILLNGAASEHAARMTAMDNATNNADDVIRSLTLLYNRARQAAITKELIEITSGADAL